LFDLSRLLIGRTSAAKTAAFAPLLVTAQPSTPSTIGHETIDEVVKVGCGNI
jgi:hypothetical protein